MGRILKKKEERVKEEKGKGERGKSESERKTRKRCGLSQKC
jgi:hypothetical protein